MLTRISTRLATPADLDALAPLFDAYRQFYEQPANVALARAFLAQRMHSQESVILLAIRNSPSTVADAAATTDRKSVV